MHDLNITHLGDISERRLSRHCCPPTSKADFLPRRSGYEIWRYSNHEIESAPPMTAMEKSIGFWTSTRPAAVAALQRYNCLQCSRSILSPPFEHLRLNQIGVTSHPAPDRQEYLSPWQSLWKAPLHFFAWLLAVGVPHWSAPTGAGIPRLNHSTTATSGSLCCHRCSFQRSLATSSRCSRARRGHCA